MTENSPARLGPSVRFETVGNPSLSVSSSPSGCGAVVTDGDYRALGVVRSLGRRGIPVCVFKESGNLLAAASRYASRTITWPKGEEEDKVRFLAEEAVKKGIQGWLLIPSDDDAAALIARHWDELAKYYRLTTPRWDILRYVSDKQLMYRLAEKLGIPYPRTFYPSSREELASIEYSFPAILKPATRVGISRFTNTKAWQIQDRASLLARYDELSATAPSHSFMIQEFIPGGGEAHFSYAVLCREGCISASVTARRNRQIPMDLGRFSTYVETVDEAGVAEPATRLLQALRFSGLIEVEFKRDPRDGIFKLLDANPRVWGWHTLCGRAGVDFPYLLWLQSNGESVPEVHGRAGVRWMRMSRDLPIAVKEILHGRLTLRDYFRSLRQPRESAVFAMDDPLPGLLEVPISAFVVARKWLCLGRR